jgi:hypothetical protein
MTAPARSPLLGFVRAVGLILMIPVGLLAALAVAILAIVVGVEAVYFFHDRPNDIAGMAAKSSVDLADDARSLDQIKAALGQPADHMRSPEADNAVDYWWWHDEAVRVTALNDTPITIDFGERRNFHLLPYQRPVFQGSFLGLRIGQPVPTLAQAASLKARAADCCDAEDLTWEAQGGRITAIHFRRAGYYTEYLQH